MLDEKEVKRGRPAKIESEQTEKKKGTRPGWRPSSVLPQLQARTGFTARWVRNEPGNIAKKLSEGWITMKPNDNMGIPINQVETPEATQLSSAIRYRDQIAMMIADEDREARQEYIKRENDAAVKGILKQSDEQFGKFGVQTYAPKGQSGRIVIE
jgi:hypothetical protein